MESSLDVENNVQDLGQSVHGAENDTSGEDTQNDLGYETASSQPSTTLSDYEHYYDENGRRYNGYGPPYPFPNDEEEQQYERMKHQLWTTLLRSHPAPTDDPRRVLDVGTGTGLWAFEFATRHPDATVLGIDVSPLQPTVVPPNLTFRIQDASEEWIEQFDYIHMRDVAWIRDFPLILEHAYNNLTPGGWIEFQEPNHSPSRSEYVLRTPSAMLTFWQTVGEGLKRMDTNLGNVEKLKDMLSDIGFVNVKEEVIEIPFGAWHENGELNSIGRIYEEAWLQNLEGLALRPLSKLDGWDQSSFKQFVERVRQMHKEPRAHKNECIQFYVVCGQKPEEESVEDG